VSVETADVVIVGGGIFGCSIAWHVARTEPKARVVVLERLAAPATQASSQAAGLLTRTRADAQSRALVTRTYDAIEELAGELGEPLPIHRVGTLHVARSATAKGALDGIAAMAAASDLAVEFPGAAEARRLVPWLATADDDRRLFVPEDAFIDPYALADAYARAARRRGVVIRLGTEVREIVVEAGNARGISTAGGRIEAATVVLAGGAWANRLAAPAGCPLPMAPVRSQYWITGTDPLFPRDQPMLMLPDARAYARPELGALLFGLREAASVSADPALLPDDASGWSFADDPDGWDSLAEDAVAFRAFCPALDRLPIRHHVAGFSTYTPDGRFILGSAPDAAGLFVASGCCGAGIAASGGVGAAIADLALGCSPSIDLTPFRPDRFGAIDPFDPTVRAHCAAARSHKRSA
jgi:Glycine/D-amino acid oxidases (deaminating)